MNTKITLFERLRGRFTGATVRVLVAWYSWRAVRRKRFIWRCARTGGGGILLTPKPMTETRALRWFRMVADGEVIYIDRNIHHIFYRPKH